MANARLADVMAAVEAWLVANWPDTSVEFIPSSSDGPRPSDDLGTAWAQPQWISYESQPRRPSEDWVVFDMRVVCQARTNDRLRVASVIDGVRDLMRSATIDIVDRSDESTARGWVRFVEVSATPPQRDARGVVVGVVDVVGWAHAI